MNTQGVFPITGQSGRLSRPSRGLLARCRCRSVRLLLLLVMWLSLLPARLLHADDDVLPSVTDIGWGDVWRWMDGGQQWFSYQNVGQWGDDDGDDIPNGLDPYPGDASNNTGWWTASNVWSDATLHATLEWAYASDRSWQLDWYDSDGDGLPNWCDPRPYDSANNTTWWNSHADVDGESREIGGVYQSDSVDWNDYDGDGLPNSFDPYPWDVANNTARWSLETYIDAILRQEAGMCAASSWQDRDGDGLPDSADPYPDSAENNTSWWHGGEHWISGHQQWFWDENRPYATAWDDEDHDGIPNFVDPMPYDAANNTAWWSGEYQIDGSYRQLGGVYAASGLDWGDYDYDGIPNFVDPYLYDSGNNNYTSAAWQDSDGDGTPDSSDPYPYDSTNNSWWDSYYSTMGQDWGDSDSDGLPNFSDLYPWDATNNTTQWYAPQPLYVDGVLQSPGGSYATNTLDWNDYDGDGLPTFADPYPWDASNNTSFWQQDAWVDGGVRSVSAAHAANEDAAAWSDRDGDALPDWLDPYPDDSDNNTALWWGQTWVDGAAQDVIGAYAATTDTSTWSDHDEDGLPDWLDSYPEDPDNNTAWWWDTAWIDGGVQDVLGTYAFDQTAAISWADADEDGLPDWLDPYPEDAANNTAWGWDESYVDGEIQAVIAAYAADQGESLSWEDRDFDGLPDWLDPYPDDFSNNTGWWQDQSFVDGTLQDVTAMFAANTDATGWSDRDEDGLPDWLDPYPDDPDNNTAWWWGQTWVDGAEQEIIGTFAADTDTTAWSDRDEDGLPDWLDPYPDDATNNTAWWSQRALVDGSIQEIGGTYATNTGTTGWSDRDDDGLPDWLDPYPDAPENNTVLWQWQTPVDGVQREVLGMYAATTDTSGWSDRDDDGLPDWADPYPDDADNNTIYWAGEFVVDAMRLALSGTYVANQDWSDADSDQLPDFLDPYPNDATNNTTAWSGAAYVDGVWEELQAMFPTSAWADSDNDGVPDLADPWPDDDTNNTSFWTGGSFTIDGSTQYLNGDGSAYATDADDADADGIPDLADPYPYDETNDGRLPEPDPETLSSTPDLPTLPAETLPDFAELPLPDVQAQPPTLAEVSVPSPEVNLPTMDLSIWEQMSQAFTLPHYPPINLDGVTPTEDDPDGDGLDDLTEALGTLTDPTKADSDTDGLADGWEVANDYDPLDPADGQADSDGDGLSFSAELHEQTDPENEDTDGGGVSDGFEVMNRQQLRELVSYASEVVGILEQTQKFWAINPFDPEDDKPKGAPAESPQPDPNPAPPPSPPPEDKDQDGFFSQCDDPDDNDPDVPVERDRDGDGVGAKTDPNDLDPKIPNGETLREKLDREKAERQQELKDRRERLTKKHDEGVAQRAADRQAQRDMNELLNHPHGNHGNGVKNPGARGTRSDKNDNGALPFQPSESYAKTKAYTHQEFKTFVKQMDIDQGRRQQLEEKLAQQNQNWGDQFKPQLADDIAQRGFGISNGGPKNTPPGVNNPANAAAGGIGAAAGFGGGAAGGFNGGNAGADLGVGPDGATSMGLDDPYYGGTPSWHQYDDQDADGDGVSNQVERDLNFNADNAAHTPTKFQLWNLELKRREAALSAAQREAEAKQQQAEQEQRALEAEHQVQKDHEAAHPEAVRQPGDVRVLDDENHVTEVSVAEGRPLLKVTRTNADGSTREEWATPTDEELADNFVTNAETGEWEKRDYTERHNNQEKRLYSTALPGTVKKAQGSLDALKEVTFTAATIVAGGAGVSGTAPKMIGMVKEALSGATGIPTGIKDLKDFVKNLFTKKALKQADDIAGAAADDIARQADNAANSASARAANTTRTGTVRTNPADWRATRDLWDELDYGEVLSDANRSKIAAGRTPVVDDAWIAIHPEDAGLVGEQIRMHHVQGLPITVPLPVSRHLDAHMPGGFRYNPGGPGSQLPIYPAPPPATNP